jgi:predicted acyltransferase
MRPYCSLNMFELLYPIIKNYIRNAKLLPMSTNQRFPALDVFRGMTVCLMIIVNTAGDSQNTFSPLLHAKWDGFTPTDLVFPSFLFAVGNALSFVMKKWEQQGNSAVLAKIFKRTLIIFLLGYLMYWFPFFEHENGHWSLSPISQTRILGVLQRIALCYCFAALMLYFLKLRLTVIISVVILLLYWGLCFWFGEAYDPLGMQTNAGFFFDRWLMGDAHMYHGEGVAFDPEGWLSTLPAIVNVVGGYVAGDFIQRKGKGYETISKLALAGFSLLVIAYFWNFLFPINKKLWTSPFVLHTVGLDCLLLAIVIYIIDIRNKTAWAPFFNVFGRNPLIIYLLSEILITILDLINIGDESMRDWIYTSSFSHAGPYWGSLLFAVTYMFICWCAGYWMDKKKIYIRV